MTDNPKPDDQARAELLATAERTALALGRSVQGKAEDTPIQTDAKSLQAIASLLASLLEDGRACGGTNCMGRSVDGVKTWVTTDRFRATETRTGRYAAALRQIATAGESPDSFDMLVDWRETTLALRRIAHAALKETDAR